MKTSIFSSVLIFLTGWWCVLQWIHGQHQFTHCKRAAGNDHGIQQRVICLRLLWRNPTRPEHKLANPQLLGYGAISRCLLANVRNKPVWYSRAKQQQGRIKTTLTHKRHRFNQLLKPLLCIERAHIANHILRSITQIYPSKCSCAFPKSFTSLRHYW